LPEALSRWFGLLGFSVMVFRQFSYWPGAESGFVALSRWGLITLLFALFLFGYLFRRPTKKRAQGPMEVLLPFACASLPFVVILLPPELYALIESVEGPAARTRWLPFFQSWTGGEQAFGLLVMAIGEVITVWGMIHLGGNFSIATDVRDWVQSGIYRWVRHPLYSGEILSLWGYVMLWPSWWSCLGTFLFTILQWFRAKREEQSLMVVFPDYEKYRQDVGMLFPKI
jgi:protein-S-isoprenylcysteine O-methyltransferase Ste14